MSLLFADKTVFVDMYELENGLTVMLNSDENANSVYGAVVVKGGGKQDPAEATGIAHYLEHMLFKGTDELGTVNYEAEKVYLDSIEILYELLGTMENQEKRLTIQKKLMI